MHDGSGRALRREPTYWTENGRLVVRERGCPEVQVSIFMSLIQKLLRVFFVSFNFDEGMSKSLCLSFHLNTLKINQF